MSKVPRGGRVHSPATYAELSQRLRRLGAQGLPNLSIEEQVKLVYDLASGDWGTQDEPVYWVECFDTAAVVAQFGFVQIEGRAERTTVDGVLFGNGAGAADTFRVAKTNSFVAPPGNQVVASSLPQVSPNQTPRARTSATAGNSAVHTSLSVCVARARVMAGDSKYVPLFVRLMAPRSDLQETCLIEGEALNVVQQFTIWGREWHTP